MTSASEVLSGKDGYQRDLIATWANAAISHAEVEPIEDPNGYFATVPGARGAWGFGETVAEAINELEEVLVDWATLKLSNGHKGIPAMGGIHLGSGSVGDLRRSATVTSSGGCGGSVGKVRYKGPSTLT